LRGGNTPSTKAIEDKIITELKDLPEDAKKEVLENIDHLKTIKKEKTLKSLKKTAGKWKGLVDAEKLKRDIYSDRFISTRSRLLRRH
jgi:phage-related protein